MADTYWATTSATGQGLSDGSSEANRMPIEDLLNGIALGTLYEIPDNGNVTLNLKADEIREWGGDDMSGSPARSYMLEIPNDNGSFFHLRAYDETPGDGGIAVFRLVGSPTAGVSGFLNLEGGSGLVIEGLCAIGGDGPNTPRGFVAVSAVGPVFINCAAVGWPDDGFYGDLNRSSYIGCLSMNNGGDGFRAPDDGRYYNCRALNNADYGFDFDDGSDGDTTVAVQCEASGNGLSGFRGGTSGSLFRCAAFYNGEHGFGHAAQIVYGCIAGGNTQYGLGDQNAFALYSDLDVLEDANGLGLQESVNSNINRNPVSAAAPGFNQINQSPQVGNDYRTGSSSDLVNAGIPIGGTAALEAAAIAG